VTKILLNTLVTVKETSGRLSLIPVAWWCTRSLWTWYLANCLWEFHQIYNLDSVGSKIYELDFVVRRSKAKVVMTPNMVEKSTALWEFW